MGLNSFGKFSVMPHEEDENKDGELEKKLSDANKRLEEENRSKVAEVDISSELNTNVGELKFNDPEKEKIVNDLINTYEQKLGSVFTERKNDVLKKMIKFSNSKSGVDVSNYSESRAFKEILLNKIDEAVNQ